MSIIVSSIVWISIYIGMGFLVPPRKWCRGYMTRFLRKIVPPRSWWSYTMLAHQYRYWLVWLPLMTIEFINILSTRVVITVGWSIVIGYFVDDLLNGDDDLKRKFEGAKNKIKWLMDLPPQPRTDVAS